MRFSSKEIFTIPNILTYIRLLCVPVFIWLMLDTSIGNFNVYIAFGIFVFASVTDVLDGYIARKFNMVSDIGKVTDPLADKLLQVSTMICLAIIGQLHYAFVLVLLLKELYMVLGGVVILKVFKSNYTIEANKWGKIATLVNSVGIIMSFFHKPEFKNLYYIDWAIVGVGALLAIYAAAQYTVNFVKYRKTELNGNDVLADEIANSDNDTMDNCESDAQIDSDKKD